MNGFGGVIPPVIFDPDEKKSLPHKIPSYYHMIYSPTPQPRQIFEPSASPEQCAKQLCINLMRSQNLSYNYQKQPFSLLRLSSTRWYGITRFQANRRYKPCSIMQKSNFAEMNISRIWRVSKQTSFTVELGKKGASINNVVLNTNLSIRHLNYLDTILDYIEFVS